MKAKKAVQYLRFAKLVKDRKHNMLSGRIGLPRKRGSLKSGRRYLNRRKRDIEVYEERQCGLEGVCIGVCIDRYMSNNNSDRIVRDIEEILDSYEASEAVIYAEHDMGEYMGMTDIMFRARKYELTNNCEYIISRLQDIYKGNDSAAIVIESEKWNRKEIFNILAAMKNCYRHINVLTSRNELGLDRIAELMYEEWGVVISIYPLKGSRLTCQDIVLFLIEQWKDTWVRRLSYHVSYIVEDTIEYAMGTTMGNAVGNDAREGRIKTVYRRFSGLKYAYGDAHGNNKCIVLPYEIAVNLAWQKPVLYQKLHISVIDICEL